MAKIKYVFNMIICLLISLAIVDGQDKHHEIKISRNNLPVESIYLSEKGFIMRFAPLNAGKKDDNTLYRYDGEANLVWKKAVPLNYGPSAAMLTIASPTGQVAYGVELKDNSLNKTIYVTRINRDGEVKTYEIEPDDSFGKKLQSVFCDDENLYLLSSVEGHETDKKKGEERLLLNVFDKDDLSRSRYDFKLPPLQDVDNSTFWYFLGQDDGHKYLISKHINAKKNVIRADILDFDNKGNTTNHLTIKPSLGEQYPRPANDLDIINMGWINLVDHDFGIPYTFSNTTHPSGGNRPNTISTTTIPLLAGAFNHWHLDPSGKYLYTYGLLGDKPFKSIGSVYNGFYIYKYDLEGKLIWASKQVDVPELLDDKPFKVHRMPAQREINLRALPDGTLNFSVYVTGTLFSYEISADGKIRNSEKREKVMEKVESLIHNSDYTFKSAERIKKAEKDKFVTFTNFYTSNGEVLFKYDLKKGVLNIFYFKP